jgi:hypothetical protein
MPRGRPKKPFPSGDDIAAVIRRNPKWAKESVVRNNPLWEATNMKRYIVDTLPPRRGRPPKIENLSTRELAEMQVRVQRAKIIAENSEKDRLRAAITKMVKENGFDVKDILR